MKIPTDNIDTKIRVHSRLQIDTIFAREVWIFFELQNKQQTTKKITPICPHTLNSRPIVVPSESILKIKLAPEARHSAYVSIDGRRSTELTKGLINSSNFSTTSQFLEQVPIEHVEAICNFNSKQQSEIQLRNIPYFRSLGKVFLNPLAEKC